jgi:hypothetical protein
MFDWLDIDRAGSFRQVCEVARKDLSKMHNLRFRGGDVRDPLRVCSKELDIVFRIQHAIGNPISIVIKIERLLRFLDHVDQAVFVRFVSGECLGEKR